MKYPRICHTVADFAFYTVLGKELGTFNCLAALFPRPTILRDLSDEPVKKREDCCNYERKSMLRQAVLLAGRWFVLASNDSSAKVALILLWLLVGRLI